MSNKNTATLVLNRGKLDELRRASAIKTEAELAYHLGVNPATLYRITQGKVAPSVGFVAKVKLLFPAAPLDALFTAKELS